MPNLKSVPANPVADSRILLLEQSKRLILGLSPLETADPERIHVGVKVLAEVIDNSKHEEIAQVVNNLHDVLGGQRACTSHSHNLQTKLAPASHHPFPATHSWPRT